MKTEIYSRKKKNLELFKVMLTPRTMPAQFMDILKYFPFCTLPHTSKGK